MSGTSAKRVVLYRFDRQPSEAFVSATSFNLADHLEIMSLEGNLTLLRYHDVKALCFVSEAGAANLFSEHSSFERRPKVAGLWVRFVLRDGDRLDGVLPHELTEWPEAGYLAVPPKAGSQRQRVFIPRPAIDRTELLGVIGKPAGAPFEAGKARKDQESAGNQLSMFD